VFIRDRAYTVMGIFDGVGRRTEHLQGVLMPASAADAVLDPSTGVERDVVISTAPGAAQLIGSQAALALRPEGPDALRVIAPPDPRTLRQEIEANVAQSALLLSVIALVIGAVSIANAATASITARVPEIGLRRALGARPGHIFAQLIGETTALGGLGGAAGVLVGVAVVAVVSLANAWNPVLDVRVAALAVAASAAAGLLAGLWPAWLATRIQPVAALQR
jgi:putative ABC transport system permease protein